MRRYREIEYDRSLFILVLTVHAAADERPHLPRNPTRAEQEQAANRELFNLRLPAHAQGVVEQAQAYRP